MNVGDVKLFVNVATPSVRVVPLIWNKAEGVVIPTPILPLLLT